MSLLLVFAMACAQQQTPDKAKDAVIDDFKNEEIDNESKEPSVLNPSLDIISPKENELIKGSRVTVELKAENFKIVDIGSPVKENEGHFHVWLGSDKRITESSAVTFENVTSGDYNIVAELVMSDHSSLSPKVSKSVQIKVESGYAPEEKEQAEDVKEFEVLADEDGFYPNKLKAKIGDKVRIIFTFRDSEIYFGGLDVKGPFPTIMYKKNGQQPMTAEFTMEKETKIMSYWPASGVKKAEMIVEAENS